MKQSTANKTSVQTYDELLQAIRNVQALSQKRLERAIDQEKVREVWETGKLIDSHVLQQKERANYGEKVIDRLSGDLRTSSAELRYALQFFRTYSIHPPADELSWAHYREILSLNEIKARKEVTAQAVQKKWTRDQVREEIRRRQSNSVGSETKNLSIVKSGKVNTYRVVKAVKGPYWGQLALDLGFSTYFSPEGISQFKENDIVVFENGELKKIQANEETLFTYNAYVTQIIDGDTFHALVDLGFKIVTEQKLRLSGLDAAIVESTDGRAAKEFLEKIFGKSDSQVLIKTVKSDKYDRYLADVWVGNTWVNQELINEGLALRVSE